MPYTPPLYVLDEIAAVLDDACRDGERWYLVSRPRPPPHDGRPQEVLADATGDTRSFNPRRA
ncbi:hypothetical protein [Streptomyces sp. NBC_00887]|uniref:hypothetical protein n=1 Tax=Streptomyces sp. NBC_00887 TaxID=2975859 RepID=UPI00386B0D1A|nr:hypothetical protein OG844_02095 [Streptomyces sp. NBC_00887]WSY36075.1 hypothetical protein OG844_43505 [Streptomyces sp. NBC_00887]